MGPTLASLLKLQSIEHDLTHVRRRLRSKQNAVQALQGKIDELTAQQTSLHEQIQHRQVEASKHELVLKSREEDISRLRTALNTAKTNKEYAAILTQINTYKADNSKLEEEILKIMQSMDGVRAEEAKLAAQVGVERQRLEQVTSTNAEEISKLEAMLAELQARRDEAATSIDSDTMRIFDRIASGHDGSAMAAIDVADAKRGEYVCGGCYMSLTAEHYNALLTKDEIRRCDNCGRILYVDVQGADANKSRT